MYYILNAFKKSDIKYFIFIFCYSVGDLTKKSYHKIERFTNSTKNKLLQNDIYISLPENYRSYRMISHKNSDTHINILIKK